MNEFATQQPTTQDSETILWKKLSDWLYERAVSLGSDNLVEPNDGQNLTMSIRAAAYNAASLSGSPPPPNQGQTQWIKSLSYSMFSLASGGDGLVDPNTVQGETPWIRSLSYSLYSMCVGIGVIAELIDPHAAQGETWWVRSASFSMYALATGIPPTNPPVNTVTPSLSNTSPRVGQTVTCSTGSWIQAASFTRQWFRDGVAIAGQTTNSHVVVTADIGKVIKCEVTAHNIIGSTTASSNNTNAILSNDTSLSVWTVEGQNVTDGGTLNLANSYDGDVIGDLTIVVTPTNGGATVGTKTLTPSTMAVGNNVLAFNVTSPDGVTTRHYSATLNVAQVGAPVNTVAPALEDTTPSVGDTVSCDTGTWTNSPTSYTYQWFRDASSIGGATSSSYVVVTGDIGAVLTCKVTAHNAGGASAPESSDATDPIPANVPVNTVAPALDDTSPGVGDTINCGTGTWTNTPTSYTYQWFRDASSIGSATASSYLVASADIGSVLTCQVVAHNAGGASAPATSNATDVIPGSSPTVIASANTDTGSSGVNNSVSVAIDTTGANLIVVSGAWFAGVTTDMVISDSKSNLTWVALTAHANSGNIRNQLFYCFSPTVGSGHTFDLSGPSTFSSIQVIAFNNIAASPFDVENGADANASSLQTGSVTPSQANSLVISGEANENNGSGGAATINSGFTREVALPYGAGFEGGCIAYKILSAIAAENPTWDIVNGAPIAISIAVFKY